MVAAMARAAKLAIKHHNPNLHNLLCMIRKSITHIEAFISTFEYTTKSWVTKKYSRPRSMVATDRNWIWREWVVTSRLKASPQVVMVHTWINQYVFVERNLD